MDSLSLTGVLPGSGSCRIHAGNRSIRLIQNTLYVFEQLCRRERQGTCELKRIQSGRPDRRLLRTGRCCKGMRSPRSTTDGNMSPVLEIGDHTSERPKIVAPGLALFEVADRKLGLLDAA